MHGHARPHHHNAPLADRAPQRRTVLPKAIPKKAVSTRLAEDFPGCGGIFLSEVGSKGHLT